MQVGVGRGVVLADQRNRVLVVEEGEILLLYRIRRKTHDQNDTGQHSGKNDPKCGLFIVQHRLDAGFYICLAKSHGAGGKNAMDAAV